MEYTPEQVRELKRCSEDPIYFIKKYARIQHPTRGAINFELYDYQEGMINDFVNNRYTIVLSARQTGKSTVAAIYLLWYAMFHFDKTILIAANKNANAMEMIHRIRYAYENLPMWLKPGITDDGWNKHSVGFDNKSRIVSTATSENAGRGMSISLLFLDEFAFVNPSIQEEFWTSISPTLSTGGSCIIASTPNGDMNLFAQLWRGAVVEANGFKAIRVFWDQPPGRDAKWKEEEMSKVGERKWMQEYECEFLSSDALLINSLTLSNLTPIIDKIKPKFNIRGVQFYKEIIRDSTYLIGVDPATGSGEDFSVIQVIEFPAMIQVAEYRSNAMSSAQVYLVLKNIIRYIENKNCTVYFSVENNGVGEGIISLFEADENPPEMAAFISEDGKKRRGFTTTKKKKMRACLTIKEMIEKDTFTINSIMLLKEFKTFARKGGSYSAQIGSTDDCISGILIIMRLLEEISSFEQEAYDALYSIEDDDWFASSSDSSDKDDDDDYNDDDYMPIYFG